MEKDPSKGRLSREAWIAAGATVVAALIGGVVTLWTHLTPPTQSPSAPVATITAATKPTTTEAATEAAAPGTAAATVRAMVGKWKGTARASDGTIFKIALEVTDKCAPGRLCGSISAPDVPCYGEVFLEKVDNGDVEFRVDNFDKRSSRQLCQPGAGEHFRLRPNGTLAYHTTYDPVADGTLTRQ